MLLPVRLKHDDPPLRLNGERISQGAVQRALPPVGEHPVLKGIFKSVRGDGLGVEREEETASPLKLWNTLLAWMGVNRPSWWPWSRWPSGCTRPAARCCPACDPPACPFRPRSRYRWCPARYSSSPTWSSRLSPGHERYGGYWWTASGSLPRWSRHRPRWRRVFPEVDKLVGSPIAADDERRVINVREG